jgi:hypothetical protein
MRIWMWKDILMKIYIRMIVMSILMKTMNFIQSMMMNILMKNHTLLIILINKDLIKKENITNMNK